MHSMNKLKKIENIQFLNEDFTSFTGENNSVDVVYSRFSIHAVSKSSASDCYLNVFEMLKPGGYFAMEARSVYDELFGVGVEVEPDAWFNTHFRRFLRMNEVVQELIQVGFELRYSHSDKGLAPWTNEDPECLRIIVKKPL